LHVELGETKVIVALGEGLIHGGYQVVSIEAKILVLTGAELQAGIPIEIGPVRSVEARIAERYCGWRNGERGRIRRAAGIAKYS
jgi:hypothetical protein